MSRKTKEPKTTLDVRQTPPPQRHPLILETFETLQPGESFVLVNDHEPKPLYYQFKHELAGQFTWQYLEQGPETWRVRIGKAQQTGVAPMNTDYIYIENLLEQVPDIPEDSIISRTLHSDNQLKTILFAFAPGQELSEHTSAKTALLHFLQGEADLTLGNDKLTAQAGTWVQMPPHLSHSITAKTSVLMLLLMFE